jgi:predicted CxxxxCH...CXXCH cytochrome family protein
MALRASGCLFVLAMVAACDLGHHEVSDAGQGSAVEASTACSSVCHGSGGVAAPPRDTSGRSDTASIGVGAHRAHISSSGWHKRIECSTCHKVPEQIGDVGHIDTPLPAEVALTGIGEGGTWDRTAETCTNTYCHGATLTNSTGAGMMSTSAGGTATAPVWTVVDGSQSQCGSCHGAPPPAPHPADSDCGKCHPTMTPGGGMTITYPELHIDGHLDVIDTASCDSCHGQAGQSAPPVDTTGGTATTLRGVGAHAAHMKQSSTWHAPFQCNECHKVPAGVNDLGHIDTPLPAEITWGPLAGSAGTWSGTTCTNTYCHSLTGVLPPNQVSGGSASSPMWTKVDGTQSQCGSCHGNPPPAPHPAGSDCGQCHPTMTPGAGLVIAYPALHMDGKVDVKNDQACDSCHGSGGNAAPPKDTTGGTSTDLRGVGAHRNHLGTSTWRREVQCTDCHKVPAAVYAVGHIDSPLPAELTFSPIAGASAWNGSTCANDYCHGSTLGGGTSKNPIWTLVNGTQGQCGSCHGTPPPAPHPVDDDCGKCHDTMQPGGGLVITDPARHIDGNLDVNTNQACNSCHGSATNDAPPKDTAGNTATNVRGVGAHQSHLAVTNRFKPVACTDCHRVPATVSSVGHIDTPLPAELTFSSRAGTNTVWGSLRCSNNYCHGATLVNGAGGAGGTTTTPLWTTVNGTQATCTSCHGNPPPLPHPQNNQCQSCHPNMSTPTTFSDATKHVDGNVDVTTGQACNSCHGGAANDAPPQDTVGNSGTTVRGVGAHQAHIAPGGTAWHKPVTCDECHKVPTAVSSTGHVDTPLPAELTFTSIAAGSTWNSTSCTSYCHGSTLAAGGTATSPIWTKVDGTQKTCTACHGNPPPAPHPQDSNCNNCHQDGGTGGTFTNAAQHIDGTTQVTQVHPTGYDAPTMHGFDFDKLGPSTCATSSCHGTALTGGVGPTCVDCHKNAGVPNWQTTCTFCHGGTTNQTGAPPEGVLGQTLASDAHVGAHTKHVTAGAMSAAYGCATCHTNPSSALTPGHVDGTGSTVAAEVRFGTLNPSGAFAATTAVCSNLYCHGTGRTSTGTATWTSTTAMTCTSCHASPPGSGSHGDHRQYTCSTCHQSVIASGSTTISTPALHVNGTREVKFSGGGTWTATTKSCSGLAGGCHGTRTW